MALEESLAIFSNINCFVEVKQEMLDLASPFINLKPFKIRPIGEHMLHSAVQMQGLKSRAFDDTRLF